MCWSTDSLFYRKLLLYAPTMRLTHINVAQELHGGLRAIDQKNNLCTTVQSFHVKSSDVHHEVGSKVSVAQESFPVCDEMASR